MAKLEIKNLVVSADSKKIIDDISFVFDSEKIYSILGPNGHGKSTILQSIMGNPRYTVESGDILLDGKSILDLEVDKRAKAGLFLGMQHPVEIPGVLNFDFLRMITSKKEMSLGSFVRKLEEVSDELEITLNHKDRYLNDGFSGGEKKKNELLQLEILKPKFALLDEIDSGLDVDALELAAKAIARRKKESLGAIIISHNDKIYKKVEVDTTIVIYKGKIVKIGDAELLRLITKYGFDIIKDELPEEKAKPKPQMISPSCSGCPASKNCGGCSSC